MRTMKRNWIVAVCVVGLVAAAAFWLMHRDKQRVERLEQGMNELRSLPVPNNADYRGSLPAAKKEGARMPNGPLIPPRNSFPIALRPAEVFVIPNVKARAFRVESRYPVQLISGGCESQSTTSIDCPASEEPIRMRDARERGTNFIPPPYNSITLTFLPKAE